jgi:hypothetical protein
VKLVHLLLPTANVDVNSEWDLVVALPSYNVVANVVQYGAVYLSAGMQSQYVIIRVFILQQNLYFRGSVVSL